MAYTDEKLENRIFAIFDHLHAHPEISWEETETTKYIADLLQAEGVSAYTFDDCTGLIAEIGSGSPVIAVRADIDALWQEVNGRYQANHSCGHDAHMAIVIGTILNVKDKLSQGTIRFIFQPAEETGSGALKMVEKGVVDDADYLFGIHLRPVEELPYGKITPAIHHGAAAFLQGKITGADAHGARPHQGINAIDIITAINSQIKTIHLSPFEPYSAKMTYMEAGGRSFNIIPGSGKFAMDIRAQKNSVLAQLRTAIEQQLSGIRNLFHVELEYEWLDVTPGAEVSEEAADLLRQGIIEAHGGSALAAPLTTSGSDDFHFYTVKRPHLKACMMGIGADLSPGLHHPNMTFDKRAIMMGMEALSRTILLAANK